MRCLNLALPDGLYLRLSDRVIETGKTKQHIIRTALNQYLLRVENQGKKSDESG